MNEASEGALNRSQILHAASTRIICLLVLAITATLAQLVVPSDANATTIDPNGNIHPSEVTLTAADDTFDAGKSVRLTATADAALNGEYIVIQDLTTSTSVAYCSYGATCVVDASFGQGGPHRYEARLMRRAEVYTDPDVLLDASSEVTLTRSPWSVTLTQDKTQFETAQRVHLIAEANQFSQYYGYQILILDETLGYAIASCNYGKTCEVDVSFETGAPHTYRAEVAYYNDRQDVEATSDPVTVGRTPWQVVLDQDKSVFEVGQKVHLTATANQRAQYSGYQIFILDETLGYAIASCNRGTICEADASFETGGPHTYRAEIRHYSDAQDVQATSNSVTARRAAWSVTLTQDKSVFAVGDRVTLTATTNQNQTRYGYRTYIYDLTSGYAIASCETGTICQTDVSFDTGSPHTYVARVISYSDANDVAAVSNEVSAKRQDWSVSLAQDTTAFGVGESVHLTAKANQRQRRYGYIIRIVDETLGQAIASCENGYVCETDVTFQSGGAHTYRAEVSHWNDANDVAAVSNTVQARRAGWTVNLVQDGYSFEVGKSVHITATANQNQRRYGYVIRIIDDTLGQAIASCENGRVCETDVTFQSGGPHTYHAEVANYSDGLDIQARSNTVEVGRVPWSVTLSQSAATFSSGKSVHLTARSSQPQQRYGYVIRIIDDTMGYAVGSCDFGRTCEVDVSFNDADSHTYHAEVAYYSDGLDIQARSNSVMVQRLTWKVDLTQDKSVFATNEYVHLTATANQDQQRYGYVIRVIDETLGYAVASCDAGRVCEADVSFQYGEPHTYHAEIANYYSGDDVQAVSAPVFAKRKPWTVALERDGDALLATANQSVQPYSYAIFIIDQTRGYAIASCANGRTCSVDVKSNESDGQTHDYLAEIAYYYDRSDKQADSNGYTGDTGQAALEPTQTVGGGNPAENNPQCSCADPVNTATGEYWENVTDLTIPGRTPLAWTRSYSSTRTSDSPLGHGWTSVLDAEVLTGNDPTDPILVRQENGSATRFTFNQQTNTYKAARNVLATLRKDSDGSWTFTRRRTTVLRFGPAGRLLSIKDRNGEGITLHRDNPDAPDRVTSLSTGTTTFTLTYEDGHITKVDGPGNAQVTYAYDADHRLTTATDATDATTTYGYDDDHRIVKVTDPEGGITKNDYDNKGRVTTQTDPLGHDTTFDYEGDPYLPGNSTTTVTDQAGRVSKYVYRDGWLVNRIQNPDGSSPKVWAYVNNALGLTTQVSDPAGDSTLITYNSRGDRTSVTDPTGSTSRWTYNEAGDILSISNPRGAKTSNTYDSNGNLLTTVTPLNPTQNATRTYTYGNAAHPGQVTAFTDSRGKTTTFGYDTEGHLTRVTSPTGATETRTYNAKGLLSTITSPRGNKAGANPDNFTTTYTYDAAGRVLTVTAPKAGTTHYAYDDNGRLTGVTDPAGGETTTAYDAAGRITSSTNSRGKTARYGYDHTGLLSKVTSPGGAVTTHAYNNLGQRIATTAPSGNSADASIADHDAATVTFTYDPAGNLTKTSTPNPDGGTPITTRTAYDAAGRVTSETDPNGQQTAYTYDPNGNVLTATTPDGATTAYAYDKANRVTSVTDANQNTTTYTYDTAGNLLRETSPLGKRTTYTYDADGNLTSVVNPRGNAPGANPDDHRTTYTYDADGNRTGVTAPTGAITTTEYDAAGRPITVTDPNGNPTTTTYNTRGLPTSITNPDGGEIGYTYDPNGKVLTATNPLGGTTTYTYDADDRIATLTDPKSRTKTYTYDTDGLLHRLETVRGTTTYTYDTVGRTSKVDYSNTTPDITFTHDPAGQITKMTDGTGTTTYGYDPNGRLAHTTHGETEFNYTYDPGGNLTSAVGPNGTITTKYDNDNQPTSRARNANDPTTYTYDPAGALKSITLPNGVTTAYTRDSLGRVTQQTHSGPDHRSATREYAYDPAGNVVSQATTRGSDTTHREYAYDPANRLTAECTGTQACTPADANLAWTYDEAGNILTKRTGDDTTTYTYDPAGQTATETNPSGDTTTYTYDPDGNLTSDATRTYAYNLAGQVTSVTAPAAATPPLAAEEAVTTVTTTYTYDGHGNRTTATTGTGSAASATNYTWDINNPLPLLAQERTGDTTQTYTYNPSGTPNSLHTNGGDNTQDTGAAAATPATYYYLVDPQGSVTDLTNPTGERVASYDYTPYGEERGPPLPATDGAPTTQPLRYTGQYLDPTTGLYNLGRRFYDPQAGRFLTPDPLNAAGDALVGNSLYAYANNSPLLYTDPSGLSPWSWVKNEWYLQTAAIEDEGWSGLAEETGLAVTSFGNAASFGWSGDIAGRLSPGAECIVTYASDRYTAARYMGYVAGVVDLAIALPRLAAYGTSKVASLHAGRSAAKAPAATKVSVAARATEESLHGSGPVPGVLELSSRAKSNKAVKNYNPKGGGVEYVFDPVTGTFATGRPAARAGLSGSPHEQLAASIGADTNRVVGGTLSRDSNGAFRTTEQSGHYWRNWTPAVREQFVSTMKGYGIDVIH